MTALTQSPNGTLASHARACISEGLCALPAVRTGDQKRAALASWRPYQSRLPSDQELDAWFGSDTQAMCLVCGAVSGNLEMIDFDMGGEAFAAWRVDVESIAPGLMERLVIESTPSGGRHVVYRCESPVSGNTKLAQRKIVTGGEEPVVVGNKSFLPRRTPEGEWVVLVTLIETRGEGGLFLCAPSDGYELQQGDLCRPPVITADERDVLLGCARAMDDTAREVVGATPPSTRSDRLRPGDDFNERGDVRELLTRHGWTRVSSGENEHWCRPGKALGTSATLKGRVFYVFSSNALPFDAPRAYSPFAVYTLLEHGGDFARAASHLASEGYGDRKTTGGANDSALATTRLSAEGGKGGVPLGQCDPESGRLVLSPSQTLPTAEAYIGEFNEHPDGRTLHSYGGLLIEWRGNRYCEIEEESVKQRLQPWLHGALRFVFNKRTGELELVDFASNPHTVKQALETIRTHVHLAANTSTPSWLCPPAPDRPPALELLPCKSMTLHIPSGRVLAPTPALFNINALDFDYDPDPEPPERWIKFLEQLFGDDLESVELLQEWMGYCLTADTSQQKMLLLVGPKRSGKGTIGGVLERLVGIGNVAGPNTGSLAETFGLQQLIGKSVAVVSDARFGGEKIGTVVERLLCISGEDTLTIDRKFLTSVTMKLPTRFMFMTNELPRLNDASTALAGRFLVLRLTKSFYGQEDLTLKSQLVAELPGILKWALDGWKRLTERGRFVQPKSGEESIIDMEDLASPVGAFIRDCCVVGAGHRVPVDALYIDWTAWCQREGRTIVCTKQSFGRDLAAAAPGVKRRRGSGQVAFYEGIGLRDEGGGGVPV